MEMRMDVLRPDQEARPGTARKEPPRRSPHLCPGLAGIQPPAWPALQALPAKRLSAIVCACLACIAFVHCVLKSRRCYRGYCVEKWFFAHSEISSAVYMATGDDSSTGSFVFLSRGHILRTAGRLGRTVMDL